MTEYLFPILGIVFAFVLMKYRERIGDTFGDPDWMGPFGGVYGGIVILAIFIIFWSIAALTDTTHLLFSPILWLFPTLRSGAETDVLY